MAAFVQHQESETFACSHLRGSFRVTRPSPFPTRTAAGHQVSPHPYGLRAQEEPHRGVWCGRREERGGGGVTKEAARAEVCRFPRALWVAKMKFTSGAAWSKSRWLSVGLCLDASLYYFKWHTAADHTNLHCTPTAPLQKDTNTLTQIKTRTLSPLWWAHLGLKRGLSWSASQLRWLHK